MNPIWAIAPALLSLAQPLAAAECTPPAAASGSPWSNSSPRKAVTAAPGRPLAEQSYPSKIVRHRHPLAYHVDYWDSLGWRDRLPNRPSPPGKRPDNGPGAGPSSTPRKSSSTAPISANGAAPPILRTWRAPYPGPSRNHNLRTESRSPGAITAHVEVRVPEVSGPGGAKGQSSTLAPGRKWTVSEVSAGEKNAGRRPEHSAVVRDYRALAPMDRAGSVLRTNFCRNDTTLSSPGFPWSHRGNSESAFRTPPGLGAWTSAPETAHLTRWKRLGLRQSPMALSWVLRKRFLPENNRGHEYPASPVRPPMSGKFIRQWAAYFQPSEI